MTARTMHIPDTCYEVFQPDGVRWAALFHVNRRADGSSVSYSAGTYWSWDDAATAGRWFHEDRCHGRQCPNDADLVQPTSVGAPSTSDGAA